MPKMYDIDAALLVKVEHHPENTHMKWCATMYRGTESLADTCSPAATREEAIAECKAKYEALQAKVDTEWLTYEPDAA